MGKYIKYWSVLALMIFLIMSLINRIPLTIDEILGISDDVTVDTCIVRLTQWDKTNSIHKDAKLTAAEFNEIINILDKYTYTKFHGNGDYLSSEGDFYTIDFLYEINGKAGLYDMSITKHGIIQIVIDGEDKKYVFSDKNKAYEGVALTYEYINDRVRR